MMKYACTKWRLHSLIPPAVNFCTTCVSLKIVPKSLKGKSKSSQDWLTRQLNDPYVKLAHKENYRARSAFKLKEIDDRHKILRHGQIIVECGAAPGAWTQVAVSKVNSLPSVKDKPKGIVVGIDILPIHPLEGAVLLGGRDFTLQENQQEILKILGDQKVNVVLSDMAPNASGNKSMDHDNIIDLAYSALRFAIEHSALESTFLCKIWDGSRNQQLLMDLKKFYASVRIVKPLSSRSDSSEKFLLCRSFKGVGT